MLSGDCTQKRLIDKTRQMKKKYKERLEVMSQVYSQLKKRKAFLENLLIKIKEKQLTTDEDVADLMVKRSRNYACRLKKIINNGC